MTPRSPLRVARRHGKVRWHRPGLLTRRPLPRGLACDAPGAPRPGGPKASGRRRRWWQVRTANAEQGAPEGIKPKRQTERKSSALEKGYEGGGDAASLRPLPQEQRVLEEPRLHLHPGAWPTACLHPCGRTRLSTTPSCCANCHSLGRWGRFRVSSCGPDVPSTVF